MTAAAVPTGQGRLGLARPPGRAPTIYRWVQAGLEEGIFSFTNDRTGISTYLSSLSPTFNTISFAPLGLLGLEK